MIVLAIETSCDDTSVAIYNGLKKLSSVTITQVEHGKYGGIVPEIASRNHLKALPIVLKDVLKESKKNLNDINYIAITFSPGLIGSLLVGVSFAKALAYQKNIPLIPINHLQAHIAVNFLNIKPPFFGIIASGGHTNIVEIKDYTKYKLIKETLDDSIGECFDKVARKLNLGYPGGPQIENLAKSGLPNIEFFPNKQNYSFSFSGLKTAVINYINNKKIDKNTHSEILNNICASFSKIATDILINQTIKETLKYKYNKIVLSGGVASNETLRKNLKKECEKYNIQLIVPDKSLCTDNADMVAIRAYYDIIENKYKNFNLFDLNAKSSIDIDYQI